MNCLRRNLCYLSRAFACPGLTSQSSTCVAQSRRFLFSNEVLGLESYERQRIIVMEKMQPIREKFVERMESYLSASDKNTVFTDDLKTVLYIAESEKELELVEQMVKRYQMQTKELGFSHFHFGPLIVRLYYKLQKPDIAFKLFTTPALRSMFHQASSAIVLMDMLFEREQYNKVLEVMDIVASNENPRERYPIDCVMLYCAACSKMNTAESLDKVKTLFKEIKQHEGPVSPRTAVYASLLAIKQNEASLALEMLSLATARSLSPPLSVANLKVLIYLKLGRFEEALNILSSYLENDVPDHIQKVQEIFADVFSEVKSRTLETSSAELKSRCEMICKALESNNHVSTLTFEEHIFMPVYRKKKYQDSYKRRRNTGGYSGRAGLNDSRETLML